MIARHLVQALGRLDARLVELCEEELLPGAHRHIPRGTRHRFEALERCVIFEVSTPELEDVVRLADDYGRDTRAPG